VDDRASQSKTDGTARERKHHGLVLLDANTIKIPANVAVRSLPRDPSVKLMPTGVVHMLSLIAKLWLNDEGQDIAEYAVMLAVILVLVVGTIRLVGSNANNAFSSVASSLQ
jgi:Flp pilus assembly pilin Flp